MVFTAFQFLIRKKVQSQIPIPISPSRLELTAPNEFQRTRNPGICWTLSCSPTVPVLNVPILERGQYLLQASSLFPLSFRPSPPTQQPLSFPVRLSGSLYLIPKYKVFYKKVAWNRGPTIDVIHSFYPHLIIFPNSCSLCLLTEETNDHLSFITRSIGDCGANCLSFQT